MSKIERSALCVHGHFSQPPRGNPLEGTIGDEPDAAPYVNWNESITENSYRPNAEIGNFNQISFSLSEGLMKWLEPNKPDVYQLIVKGDNQKLDNDVMAGNALATAYNHVILPLSRKRDKRTQIIWGIAAFERHFKRKPLGFWLPEMAVDSETLSLLAELGIQYTLLTAKQVPVPNLPAGQGAGPYRVALPNGRFMGVFVRNDELSSEISFNIHTLGGAGRWSHRVLGPARKTAGPLTLLATAGETFGHHFAGEEQFLHWLVTYEAQQAGYEIVTLDHYYLNNPPTQSIQIEERSTWGDQPGLTAWATGYASPDKDTTWKGALRRALDNAASDVDQVYEEVLSPYKVDPWELRNQYLPALSSGKSPDDFIAEYLPKMKPAERENLKALFQAQRLTQRMYNSYTFTDNQLDGRQPRYAVACAATAISLAQQATTRDLNDRLPADLAVVTTNASSVTGADMLREAVEQFGLKVFSQ